MKLTELESEHEENMKNMKKKSFLDHLFYFFVQHI